MWRLAEWTGSGTPTGGQSGRVRFQSIIPRGCVINYAQIEKELSAIVFSMNRFHSYVYGKKVIVETDHKPLIAIMKKSLASAPKRLQWMLLQLQRYDIELIYRPGSQMFISDGLSRAFYPSVGEASEFSKEVAALCDEQQHEKLHMVASPGQSTWSKKRRRATTSTVN